MPEAILSLSRAPLLMDCSLDIAFFPFVAPSPQVVSART